MTSAVSVRASRRAPWSDLRFLLGIVLIVVSVAGVWAVVTGARQTDPVYVAARTIVVGAPVTTEDLELVDVALGQASERYLAAGDLVSDAVATRTIAAGELVAVDAMAGAGSTRMTNVVVRSAVEVPASVEAGSVVEVWAAPLVEHGRYEEPRILVADATVASVARDESMMGGGAASVEIVVARADVAAVLAAAAADAAVSIVPVTGHAR